MLSSIFFYLTLFITPLAHAANIVDANDIVLEHNGADNFIFKIEGDNGIYACELNRCHVSKWLQSGAITMQLFELPPGFPSATVTNDIKKLQEYTQSAAFTYVLRDITIPITKTGKERAYLTVQLNDDGTYLVKNDTYVKPEVKLDKINTMSSIQDTDNKRWWIFVGIGLIILGIGGLLLWKYYRSRRLRY